MSVQDAVQQRPGRRRDPACDEAIRNAALAEFVEQGYGGISMEGVAARAGVGKATVYRRYKNKAELTVDAVRGCAFVDERLPDTGDLRADLTAILRKMIDRLSGPDGPILVAFAAERLRHPDLAAEFERSVIGDKRSHVRRLLLDARERGELAPDADIELLGEAGPAMVWHHAMYDLPLTADLAERILDVVLAPHHAPSKP